MKPTPRFTAALVCSVLVSLLVGYTDMRAQDTLRTCGNEAEPACGLLEKDVFNGVCDSGLRLSIERCGCLLRGLFGNCLIPRLCSVCRNDTRHRPATASLFANSWVSWALRNQREQLAVDEPLNWVMHLGTHNAFNTYSDGHEPRALDLASFPILSGISEIADAPNHFYSMTSQLDLGSRLLALDAYFVGPPNNARLCHAFHSADHPWLAPAICMNPSGELGSTLFPAMRYFANGIKEIRNWMQRHPDAIVMLNLENYIPGASDAYVTNALETYLDARSWILRPSQSSTPFPSRAEMLAMGKRVVVIFNGMAGTDLGFDEDTVVAGDYEFWLRRNQDFAACLGRIGSAAEGPANADANPGKFTVVVEDRTLQRGFAELLHLFAGFGPGAFGQLSAEDLRNVARCNYTIVATDFLGSQLPLGRSADIPDFSRHDALVWSWQTGDRGQNGDCAALDASSGRWVSADCSQPKHYACAPPRSESGTDRSTWRQREDRWWISSAPGPWDGGAIACAQELPMSADHSTPYVFSVPVNGYQNERLKAANVRGVDVWLNYTDRVREGAWVIPKLTNANTRPVADAGEDQTVECGSEVRLDGTGSVDANGDSLTYTWTGPFGTLTGPVAVARLEAGEHVITLTVNDGRGGVDTDSTTITVADTKPPSLYVTLSSTILWPANHEMVKVKATVEGHDRCDGSDVLIELVSIVSSEPDDETGDGKTEPDIQEAEFGTGDLEFLLRAERSGKGPGRVYSVTYRATDKGGNRTDVTQKVVVPHDPGK